MWKIFLLGALLILNSFGSAAAQAVTVSGLGVDRDSAVRDATRLAVEQVAGTFIDSRTLMEDLVIQLDEVYKNSRGFVKSIKILEEGMENSSTYRVKARIDVDTNPNGELIDQLTMIMQLNDPRILVLAYDMKNSARNIFAEESMNEKLINDLGFSHIVSADVIPNAGADFSSLNEAELLRQTLSGYGELFSADYLVFARFSKIASKVAVPKYGVGMTESPFVNVKAIFKVDVIKYDTAEVIGTFAAEGAGMESDETLAEHAAISQASQKAAEKLESTFKKLGAKTTQGISFTIVAADNAKLNQILGEMRALGIIDNIHVREISNNAALLSIDSVHRPYEIVDALKKRSKLGIFIENITNSACKLIIN